MMKIKFRLQSHVLLLTFAIGLLGWMPLSASDSEALNILKQARAAYNVSDLNAEETAIQMYHEARDKAVSSRVKEAINVELSTAVRNYIAHVKRTKNDFLDRAYDDKWPVYAILNQAGDVRGTRLCGEYLLAKGSPDAKHYIMQAAEAGDARAAFLAAEGFAYGLSGWNQNSAEAFKWILQSASAGYLPASEQLAELYWDGSREWNVWRNQEKALFYVNHAAEGYKRVRLRDKTWRQSVDKHRANLEYVRREIRRYIAEGTDDLGAVRYPKFLALRMSFYSESEQELRARAYYINHRMLRYAKEFNIDQMVPLDLSLIPIYLARTDERFLAAMATSRSELLVSAAMDVYTERYREVTDTSSRWYREMKLTDSIAHELAHAYFLCRYPYVLSGAKEIRHEFIEGHACSTGYAMTRDLYMDGDLTPREYHQFLSSDYAGYFDKYRSTFALWSGGTDWNKVKQFVLAQNPSAKPQHPVLVPQNLRVFKAPEFFGHAFYGYM